MFVFEQFLCGDDTGAITAFYLDIEVIRLTRKTFIQELTSLNRIPFLKVKLVSLLVTLHCGRVTGWSLVLRLSEA